MNTKNKNLGFTLVELLAVIIILGVIATIIFPAVGNIIKKSKQKTYNNQVEYILNASENWISANPKIVTTYSTFCVKLSTLKTSGYLTNEDIINPIDDTVMDGYVQFSYNTSYNQYDKEYKTTCDYSHEE